MDPTLANERLIHSYYRVSKPTGKVRQSTYNAVELVIHRESCEITAIFESHTALCTALAEQDILFTCSKGFPPH
jgi:hypothetical protein